MSILEGKDHIFLTAAAGYGKTTLVKEYIKDKDNVFVTASTGIAAQELQGCTLHRLLSLQLCQGPIDTLVSMLMKKKKIYDLWMNKIKVLIIDEISMLDIGFFIRAGKIIQAIHGTKNIWGNIRLILVGDWLQLPNIHYYQEGEGDNKKTYRFLFQHPVWQELNPRIIHLTIPRRTTDEKYLGVLQDIRYGILSERVKDFFEERSKKPVTKNGVRPTFLIGTNAEVDLYNKKELDKLEGQLYTYVYEFDTLVPETIATREQLQEDMRKGSLAPDILNLKIGSQVIFLVNDTDKNLCNGSRGVVIDIADSGYPIVKFKNGKIFTIEPYTWNQYIKIEGQKYKMSRTQIPLKLCWAISFHKSQGSTLDSVVLMINTCFEGGMLYVGLSRCRHPDDLFIVGFDRKTIDQIWKKCTPNQAVIKFYRELDTKE